MRTLAQHQINNFLFVPSDALYVLCVLVVFRFNDMTNFKCATTGETKQIRHRKPPCINGGKTYRKVCVVLFGLLKREKFFRWKLWLFFFRLSLFDAVVYILVCTLLLKQYSFYYFTMLCATSSLTLFFVCRTPKTQMTTTTTTTTATMARWRWLIVLLSFKKQITQCALRLSRGEKLLPSV